MADYIWEKENNFIRVEQKDWETPVCNDWIDTLHRVIMQGTPEDTILVCHSLACAAVAFWAKKYNRQIKGALLVAPSDTEADTYPKGTTGFRPMPLQKFPFQSITVASTDDYYISLDRAQLFADRWGSELVTIGNAGHINVASGFGEWKEGLLLLKRLDEPSQ